MILLGVLLQQDGLISLASLLLALVATAWLWQVATFWRVDYERVISERRVFQGESIQLSLRISNRKWLPLAWFRILERVSEFTPVLEQKLAPSDIPQMGELDVRASLFVRERARWDFTLNCDKRGVFRIGPAILRSGDLFGLFVREISTKPFEKIIVYPRIRPLADWGLPPKEPLGEALSRVRAFEDATRVRSIRDYYPDDSIKSIHWRATAHRGELQVKVNEPTVEHTWMLILNIATFEYAWSGTDVDRVEQAISMAASVANYAADQRYAIGVLTNAAAPDSDQPLRILPGRGPNQLRSVLELLSACTYFVSTPIQTLLVSAAPRLPWGALLVVITPLVTSALLVEMQRLAQIGRKLALISLDESWTPVMLEGIVVRSVVPSHND